MVKLFLYLPLTANLWSLKGPLFLKYQISITSLIHGIRKTAPRKLLPRKLIPRTFPPRKLPPMNILPYENSPPPPSNLPPRKLPPGKITPNEIPSPLINHTNERKNKIIEFFVLKKAMQYNILIKITKVHFDTQTISQKLLGLGTFFTD